MSFIQLVTNRSVTVGARLHAVWLPGVVARDSLTLERPRLVNVLLNCFSSACVCIALDNPKLYSWTAASKRGCLIFKKSPPLANHFCTPPFAKNMLVPELTQ
jgi:hypothetical protein